MPIFFFPSKHNTKKIVSPVRGFILYGISQFELNVFTFYKIDNFSLHAKKTVCFDNPAELISFEVLAPRSEKVSDLFSEQNLTLEK